VHHLFVDEQGNDELGGSAWFVIFRFLKDRGQIELFCFKKISNFVLEVSELFFSLVDTQLV